MILLILEVLLKLEGYKSQPFSISFTLSKLMLLLISIFCLLSLERFFAIMMSVGLVFLKFIWNFLVVSKKLSLIFFAINSIRFISETLKNVITTNTKIMRIANTAPNSFASALEKLLKVAKAITIPIAIKNIWIKVILNPKILIPAPEKKPF